MLRADRAVSAYWLASLLGWAYLVVGIVAGWPALMWVVLAVMGSWLLGATVLWPVMGRIHPHPVATVAGAVDGERWLHVAPVHPAFAAAVDHLPGSRPPAGT